MPSTRGEFVDGEAKPARIVFTAQKNVPEGGCTLREHFFDDSGSSLEKANNLQRLYPSVGGFVCRLLYQDLLAVDDVYAR